MNEQNRPADETGQQSGSGAAGHGSRVPDGTPGGTGPATSHPAPAPQQPVPPQQPWAAGPQGGQPPTGPGQGWGAQHPAGGWPAPGQQPRPDTGPLPGQGHGQLPPVFQPAPQPPARRAGRGRLVVAALLAGALIGGGAGAGVVALADDDGAVATPVSAQSVVITDADTATSATAAAAKAAPSVVTLYVSGGSSSGSGSGIVLSADGYVLTNDHVVTLDGSTESATVQVRTADGTLYAATVVGTDPTSDLAVVELTDASGLTPATFADSDDVQVGDLAVAIGAPLGLSNTVTDGIISATNRAVATGSDTSQTVIEALQTDAAINPGNSGGALVDASGEVVGVNSAIASVAAAEIPGQAQTQSGNIGVGFAIPSNTAQRIADEIVRTGSAQHALLGVSAQTAADGQGSQVGVGAEVAGVQAGGPAAAAGIEVGDVITGIDGRAVTSSVDLTAAVRSAEPGATATLTVRRGTGTSTVDVTLGTATS